MKHVQAPGHYDDQSFCIFLAGTIDMGSSIDWQNSVAKELEQFPVTVLNPRRDSWDSTWEQNSTNEKFVEQVNWELNALDASDIIFLHLESGSQSPITLLELGIHARGTKLIVSCGKEFWRRGNVEIVCQRNNIAYFEEMSDALDCLKKTIISTL